MKSAKVALIGAVVAILFPLTLAAPAHAREAVEDRAGERVEEPVAVSDSCGGPLIAQVEITAAEVVITPTDVGRTDAGSNLYAAWMEIRACATTDVPRAQWETLTVVQQFICHAVLAPFALVGTPGADVWNLETSRTATWSLWTWIRTGCNW